MTPRKGLFIMKEIYKMTDDEILNNYYHYIKPTIDKYSSYFFIDLVKKDLENYLIEKTNYYKKNHLESHVSNYLNRMIKGYLKRFSNINNTLLHLMIKYPESKELLKPILGYNLLLLARNIIKERNLDTNEYIDSSLLIIINNYIEDELLNCKKKFPISIDNKFSNKIKKMSVRNLVYAFEEEPDNIDLIEQKYSYLPYLRTEKYNGILNKKMVFEEFYKKYLSLVEKLDSYEINLNKYFNNNLTMKDYKVHRLENKIYRNCYNAGKKYIDVHSVTEEEYEENMSKLSNLVQNYMEEEINNGISFFNYIKKNIK